MGLQKRYGVGAKHSLLEELTSPDQHPISAITGAETRFTAIEKAIDGFPDDTLFIDAGNPPAPLVGLKGDGTVEHTAFVALMAYAAQENKELHLREGTFKVYGFNPPENCQIVGKNRNETELLKVSNPALKHTAATLTNLLGVDGNFVNDANADGLGDTWSVTNVATKSMAENVQTIKISAQYGKMSINPAAPAGNLMYAAAFIKTDSASVCISQNESPYTATNCKAGKKGYQFVSVMFTNVSGVKGMMIQDKRSSGWTDISVKCACLIDTSAAFGLGTEPTQIELDHYVRRKMENAYFSSASNVTVHGTEDFVTLSEDNSGLKNLYLHCDYWNNGGGSNGVVFSQSMNNCILEDVKINFAVDNGIKILAGAWVFSLKNIIVWCAQGWGLYNLGSDNRYNDMEFNACRLGNIYAGGANNIYGACKSMSAGLEYDDNDAPGLMIACSRSMFVNFDVQENAGHGVYFKNATGNVLSNIVCDSNGCDYSDSSQHCIKPLDGVLKGDGFYFEGSSYNTVLGLVSENRNTGAYQSQNHGYVLDATSTYNKLVIAQQLNNNAASTDSGTGNIVVENTWIPNLLDAKGAMLYASAAKTPAKLAVGARGQKLRVKTTDDIPEWFTEYLEGTATYDPIEIDAEDEPLITTITVAGATLGMIVKASFSIDLAGVIMQAYVSAADTVSIAFYNWSGTPVNLGSGTIKVRCYY